MRPSKLIHNRYLDKSTRPTPVLNFHHAQAFHDALKDYKLTPLLRLPALARKLGLKNILLKDESQRFGLNAFKGLGASYAIYRFLQGLWQERFGETLPADAFCSAETIRRLSIHTFTTATDGNHGRAVAWTARKLGQKAVIYVPENTAFARIENLKREGAEVVVVAGNYDAAVRQCSEDAQRFGRQTISDMGWPGYEEIPRWISTGYGTLFLEAGAQIHPGEIISHVFLQTGVGGLACAGAEYFRSHEPSPRVICVEPLESDCFHESIASGGDLRETKGNQTSIMAGLNCGTPSSAAWPYIKTGADAFLAIDDGYAEEAMRTLYNPSGADPRVISGESGAAGLAGLLALSTDPGMAEHRTKLGFNNESIVLLLNTEGDTDPENFQKVVGQP